MLVRVIALFLGLIGPAWAQVPSGSFGDGTCGDAYLDAGEACDDGNQASGDCCSPTCTIEPIDGTCWRVAFTGVLRIVGRTTLDGVAARCSGKCRNVGGSTLALFANGTYRSRQGLLACTDGSVALLPDETGRWRRKGRSIRLTPDNLPALAEAIVRCTGRRLVAIRSAFRISADVLRGTVAAVVRADDPFPALLRSRAHVAGIPLAPGLAPDPPRVASQLEPCDGQIELACRPR